MKKLLIYNYDANLYLLAKFKNYLTQYQITALLSPPHLKKSEGLDASYLNLCPYLGIELSRDYEAELNDADAVLFNYMSIENVHFQRYIMDMQLADRMGKEILLTKELYGKMKEEHSYSPTHYNLCSDIIQESFETSYNYRLEDIAAPIITVYQISEYLPTYGEVEMSLYDKFVGNGYKASLICNNYFGNLLGTRSLPEFVLNNQIDVFKRIFLLNSFIREVELAEEPDIIIIGIPTAVMQFNNLFHNNFGIVPFIASNAFNTDICILNLFNQGFTEDIINEYLMTCKYKLDCDLTYFQISNAIYSYATNSRIAPSSLYMNYDKVKKTIKDCNALADNKAFSIFDDSSFESIFNSIINELSGIPSIV